MTLFKKYTIRHETTGEIKDIIAYDFESDSPWKMDFFKVKNWWGNELFLIQSVRGK